MRRFLILVFVVTLTGPMAHAEHILLPIFVSHAPGAGGSTWTSEFFVHNPTASESALHPICPYLSPCHQYLLPAHSTVQPVKPGLPGDSPFPGLALIIDDSALDVLTLQLRVFAESHGTWGALVPIVRWSRVTSSKLRFIQIPSAPNLRHTVRIYAETPESPMVVVRYFDDSATGSVPLLERVLSLQSSPNQYGAGFAQLSSGDLPDLSELSRLRIEVEAVDPAKRIWGMVSITDAATQEFSIVSPD